MTAVQVYTTASYESELAQAKALPTFADLEVEIQTDKPEGKLVPCRGCKRPLLVNRFYSPAQASCKECGLSRALTSNGNGAESVMEVEESVLADTLLRYPSCRCERLGLVAGMPVDKLVTLEEGCTGSRQKAQLQGSRSLAGDAGWICERLNRIRRRYGQ